MTPGIINKRNQSMMNIDINKYAAKESPKRLNPLNKIAKSGFWFLEISNINVVYPRANGPPINKPIIFKPTL